MGHTLLGHRWATHPCSGTQVGHTPLQWGTGGPDTPAAGHGWDGLGLYTLLFHPIYLTIPIAFVLFASPAVFFIPTAAPSAMSNKRALLMSGASPCVMYRCTVPCLRRADERRPLPSGDRRWSTVPECGTSPPATAAAGSGRGMTHSRSVTSELATLGQRLQLEHPRQGASLFASSLF